MWCALSATSPDRAGEDTSAFYESPFSRRRPGLFERDSWARRLVSSSDSWRCCVFRSGRRSGSTRSPDLLPEESSREYERLSAAGPRVNSAPLFFLREGHALELFRKLSLGQSRHVYPERRRRIRTRDSSARTKFLLGSTDLRLLPHYSWFACRRKPQRARATI